ncbi:MAG: hypothetical protein EKK39_06455 [Sphingobacteriales bacterium]|uniref:hypothetical protein n=1 Tax=Hydrotalea flava TaxID=714549 RepID=UPI00082F4FE0|nr:hypothetical protein [Hydrotalea flava]RTL52614.1 MAG: hypothetical protein EKK39_06455 [Sphingobacteriales bacterium]
MDSAAYVVCTKYRSWDLITPSLIPNKITGQWVIHVSVDDTHTNVQINLANAVAKIILGGYGSDSLSNPYSVIELPVKSTGVFEQELRKAIVRLQGQ